MPTQTFFCNSIQVRQRTYIAPVRRVLVTTVAVEKQKYYIFSVYVCSFSYPACKVHAPYYIVICSMSGSTKFFTLPHKRLDFRGGVVCGGSSSSSSLFPFAVRRRVPITIFYTLSYSGPVFSLPVTFFLLYVPVFPHIEGELLNVKCVF
jgi:hypothetical protein